MNIEQEPTTSQTDENPRIYTLEDIRALNRENELAIRDRVVEAISNNPNKEPFNYAKFVELYWRKDPQGDLRGDEDESIVDRYVERYYLDFPDVNTIEEFAKNLEELDAQAGN